MKTMEWVILTDNDKVFRTALVERQTDRGILVWGFCHPVADGYRPVVRQAISRSGFMGRGGLVSIIETLSLEDTKLAIEKKLFDDQVLAEGDEIVDNTI